MPVATTWATFYQAVQTGITKTTEALETLYKAHKGQSTALVALAETPNGFAGMPNAIRTALEQEGLSEPEILHVEKWPDNQKEDVRLALLDAMNSDRAVLSRWKLHNGSKEDTIIETSGNLTTITFYSPVSKVKAAAGDFTVKV